MVPAQWFFISGGVRSGKSHFAEQQTLRLARLQHRHPYYIASGVAFDQEMAARISKHRLDREQENWHTIEKPIEFFEIESQIPSDAVVLWDCATTWLTNEMYRLDEENRPFWQNQKLFQQQIEKTKKALIMLQQRNIPIIIVSNEVLDELNYASKEVEFYRQQLGQFHQWLVQKATSAVEMEYGVAHFWKGAE